MNEQVPEPGPSIGERLTEAWTYVRTRPNFVVFAIGVALFFGGLISVVSSQLSPPSPARLVESNNPSPAPTGAGRVGPTLGEAVAPYIADRRSVTSDRAAKAPREATVGIVVFNSYRKASEVQELMKTRGLEAVSIETRIPLTGFTPRQVPLEGRSIVEAALSEKGAINRDLEVLEKVASEATSEFRSVYEHDLQLHRDALALLGDDPATVYAVVVKGTNQAMGRTASSAQVRYVDLPEDPTDEPADILFTALLPEDTETSSVGPAPENSPEPDQ